MQWITHHWVIIGIVATWLFNNVVTVMVSNLEAPTKDSSAKYVYWFKVANTFVGNIARAKSTTLESSPNWTDAVNAHIQKVNGGTPQNPTPKP